MIHTLTFRLHTKPVGKQRPRVNRMTGNAYTPTETVRFEREVKKIALAAREARGSKLEDAWPMRADAYWMQVHTFKTTLSNLDGDNVFKSVADALNGVLYDDDHRVGGIFFPPKVSADPGVYVRIQALDVAWFRGDIEAKMRDTALRTRLLNAAKNLVVMDAKGWRMSREFLELAAVVEEVERGSE